MAYIGRLEKDVDGVVRYSDFPEYAVCYVMYGDASGLSKEDVENIDSWLVRKGLETASLVDVGEERYFSSHPELGLACDCVDVAFLKYPKN